MNEISVVVEHLTTVQRPRRNNASNENQQIIPSQLRYADTHDDSIDGIESTSDIIQTNLPSPSKYRSLIQVCTFILFTIISSTIGIVVVCVALSNQKEYQCVTTFIGGINPVFTYDSRPRHIAIGDFNGDNSSDLVIANSGVHNIAIHFGQHNGTFTKETVYSTGINSRPYSVGVGYFNKDTFLDIVVAKYGTNDIGVFFGDGKGNFTNQTTYSLNSSRPTSLVVQDINKDTISDIVLVSYGIPIVTILLGLGDGLFQIGKVYDMGYDSMPRSIAIADFNNDNRFDIVIVNNGTSDIAILLATENGTFLIKKYSTGIGSQPCSVTVGDFDNDNRTDIAIANSATRNIGILIGNGDGTFKTMITYSTGSNSYLEYIVTGDFNNDNKLDLVVANSGENNIIVFENNGNGTFSIKANQSTGVNSYPCAIAADDLDKDTKIDIVVVNMITNYIIVFAEYAFHTIVTQKAYSAETGSYPSSAVVGYFDNDTLLDIVVTNTYASNIGVFLGSSNNAFKNQKTFPTYSDGAGPYSIASGDFNKDKKLDIAVAMRWAGTIEIYFGQGNGEFEYQYRIYTGDDYTYPFAIITADLNNDTNLDIVTANCDGDTLSVIRGSDDGDFTDQITYSVDESSSCPVCVSTADFNNDGVFDLVSADCNSATISIFLGNGNGTFQDCTTISTDDYCPDWLIVEDLNNDKLQDIVFISFSSSALGVFIGYGNVSFGNIEMYFDSIPTGPTSLVTADVNNDTIPDIIVANGIYPSISIFFGDGNGSFSDQEYIELQDVYYSYYITTGDFNNDGEMDLVTTNAVSDDISVLLLHYKAIFGTEEAYPQESSTHPTSVTMADFDNDHQMDIIVANSGQDNVQILIGYGNNTFKNTITYSTGINSHPSYAIAADFNKDKQLDIAVINSYIDTLAILLVSENKTILNAFNYSTGVKSSPNSIGYGDFNKDGWIDIVVANNNTNNIGVFLGYAYPTFIKYNIDGPRRGSTPYNLVVADFNKDSQYDIAVAYLQMNTIDILLGNGDGTFQEPLSNELDDLSDPMSLTVGDFDKDNNLDIAVANSRSTFINILLGYGNGSFHDYMPYSTGSTPSVSIAVGDFNNDTIPDIVVANKKDNSVGIFIGYGNGSFADQTLYQMVNGSVPVSVVVADFNNDNISDVAVANRNGGNIHILSDFVNGSFRNVTIYLTGNNSGACSIATGDFNKDNSIDIAVANRYAKNIQIFVGYGNGTFSLETTYSTGERSSLGWITAMDVDNDTKLDLAFADWGTGDAKIGVLYGLNDGTFPLRKDYSGSFDSEPTSVAVYDFNNDGRSDFAISNSNDNSIGIMLQDKVEYLGAQTTYSTDDSSTPCSVAIMDLNNDNQSDIAVTNFLSNNVGIFYGNGDGTFGKQNTYSTGNNSGPISITIGDLNNDTKMDIIVANFIANNIAIFYSDGKGDFRSIITYSTGNGSQPTSVSIASLTRANYMDIIVTLGGTNTLLIFNGYGNETFSSPESFLFNFDSRPISTAIGDLNNDTVLDIALAHYGLGYVDVLLRTCV